MGSVLLSVHCITEVGPKAEVLTWIVLSPYSSKPLLVVSGTLACVQAKGGKSVLYICSWRGPSMPECHHSCIEGCCYGIVALPFPKLQKWAPSAGPGKGQKWRRDRGGCIFLTNSTTQWELNHWGDTPDLHAMKTSFGGSVVQGTSTHGKRPGSQPGVWRSCSTPGN